MSIEEQLAEARASIATLEEDRRVLAAELRRVQERLERMVRRYGRARTDLANTERMLQERKSAP